MEDNIHHPLTKGRDIIKSYLENMPNKPGVYRMFDGDDKVLYVGKAKDLKKRVYSYTVVEKLPNRLQRMVSQTSRMEIVTTNSEIEALLLESNLIKKLQPTFNILLKDDKSFPYVLLTKDHNFPKITKHRGPQTTSGDYFGPFASVQSVDESILSMQRIFQIRNCSDNYFSNRKRPCLQYHIKRCSAPCVNKISKDEYQNSIDQVKLFLNGKDDLVQKTLAEKMQNASDNMEYETAAIYRDRIKLLTQIQSKQRINVKGINDADIIALYRFDGHSCGQIFFFRNNRNLGTQSIDFLHDKDSDIEDHMGAFLMQFYNQRCPAPLVILSHTPTEFELIKQSLSVQHGVQIGFDVPKKGIRKELIDHAMSNAKQNLQNKLDNNASFRKIFDQLADIFKLSASINKIEVYDNSHLFGTNAYGVMIAVNNDGFDKKSYRKFAITNPKHANDDFAMMREVITRRVSHKEWPLPDLFLIDGGQGQISVVEEVLKTLSIDIPVIGIAKGPNRNAGQERFFYKDIPPISLQNHNMLLYFLQNIRDEAHRFAIQTHRAKRQKGVTKSLLDQIPGIGSARKKALLQHFGSASCVLKAGVKDLLIVNGISQKIAEKIYAFSNEK